MDFILGGFKARFSVSKSLASQAAGKKKIKRTITAYGTPPSHADNTRASVAPIDQIIVAFVPLTPPSTQPLEVEVVAQVGTSASPHVADFHGLDQQTFVEKDMAIHPYMPMSTKLVIVNDFVLADPEVGFAVGISVVLPEDQKIL